MDEKLEFERLRKKYDKAGYIRDIFAELVYACPLTDGTCFKRSDEQNKLEKELEKYELFVGDCKDCADLYSGNHLKYLKNLVQFLERWNPLDYPECSDGYKEEEREIEVVKPFREALKRAKEYLQEEC